MTRLTTFLVFWLLITLSLHVGNLWLLAVLLALFLVLWTWAEEADQSSGVAPLQVTEVTVREPDLGSIEEAAREHSVGKDADKVGERSIRC